MRYLPRQYFFFFFFFFFSLSRTLSITLHPLPRLLKLEIQDVAAQLREKRAVSFEASLA